MDGKRRLIQTFQKPIESDSSPRHPCAECSDKDSFKHRKRNDMATQREQFEAWFITQRHHPNDYHNKLSLQWSAWQVAQAQQAAVEPVAKALIFPHPIDIACAMTEQAKARTSGENIADVLFALSKCGMTTTPPSTQAAMRAALGVADKLRHALSNVLQSAPKDVWPKWLAVRDECDAEMRSLRGAVTQEPNFCESCAMDLSTCDCVESRPAYVQAAPDTTVAMRAALECIDEYADTYSAHWVSGMPILETLADSAIKQLRAALGEQG